MRYFLRGKVSRSMRLISGVMFGETMDTELIRQLYRPSDIRLLLVGESPPASKKFFYVKSAMTKHTAQAFKKAYGASFRDDEEFLHYFKICGCYLDDLCHDPVDDLPKAQREECLKTSIDGLAQRICEMNPSVLAIVLKKIERYVQEAVCKSGRQPKVFVLPFPGNGHQTKYINQLCEILCTYVPAKT
jgi:hypothetical protein